MTALPRAVCPRCGQDVAVRRGGQIREHRVRARRVSIEAGTRRVTKDEVAGFVCNGSGEMAP